jgi:4a-hydroxytetrahydrobiopterin dehydratase
VNYLKVPSGLVLMPNKWESTGNRLEKEFLFQDFATALEFVNKIGSLAEKENHHPDILLSYGKVKVVLWTHDAGGITEKDTKLAEMIDKL